MVIVPNRVGQLGNQLFHIAHFASSAIENHFKVIFGSFEFPLDQFPNINSNKYLQNPHLGGYAAKKQIPIINERP